MRGDDWIGCRFTLPALIGRERRHVVEYPVKRIGVLLDSTHCSVYLADGSFTVFDFVRNERLG